MSYQVLARKYRPQRFEDVVGQEHVTQTLANAIKSERIAHAYLFTGPRGTGKTTLARIFAKCLNATDGPRVDFAEDDPRCVEIAEGRSLDVMEIDGASNNGVEQVRDLRETCRYAPANGRYKIYIIDEVHMLSTQAFNALLKTLEEPPAHVKFLFATTDPEKVLATILSRCQRFDLRRIPVPLIVQHLGNIAAKEQVDIDAVALNAIARGADGGMRDAESTLDQLISFCGDTIVEADVLSMFGLAAQGQLLALARAILNADGATAVRELNQLSANGKDLGRLLGDLLNHFRNLMLLQISGGDPDQIEVSESELEALREEGEGVTVDQIRRIMEVLSECEWKLRDAASKKITIEIALLRAIEARQAVSLDAVLKQLKALQSGEPVAAAVPAVERSAPKPASPAPKPVAREPLTPVPDPTPVRESRPAAELRDEPKPKSGPIDLEVFWREVITRAGKASPFTRTYLLEAHPVSLDGEVFTIGFDPEFSDHIGFVDNSRTHEMISALLAEQGRGRVRVKFIEAEAPVGRVRPVAEEEPVPSPPSEARRSGPPAPASTAASKSDKAPGENAPPSFDPDAFKDDPLIKQALEIFKGQIVNVRS